MPASTREWSVIVPLKPWHVAKSRLAVDSQSRTALAEAFARDVLEIVAMSSYVGQLVVVSAEPTLTVPRAGKAIILRPPTTGLNAAISFGSRWVRRTRPGPVAVVPGDLPALTLPVFEDALKAATSFDRAHVPDRDGKGTTILTAADPCALSPNYGPDSARRHAVAGSHVMTGVDIRTRCDIDTIADLAHAQTLGVGKHSAEAIRNVEFCRMWGRREPRRPATI